MIQTHGFLHKVFFSWIIKYIHNSWCSTVWYPIFLDDTRHPKEIATSLGGCCIARKKRERATLIQEKSSLGKMSMPGTTAQVGDEYDSKEAAVRA